MWPWNKFDSESWNLGISSVATPNIFFHKNHTRVVDAIEISGKMHSDDSTNKVYYKSPSNTSIGCNTDVVNYATFWFDNTFSIGKAFGIYCLIWYKVTFWINFLLNKCALVLSKKKE